MGTALPNRAVRLKVLGGKPADVSGTAIGMDQFLAEPNAPAMVARVGDELVVGSRWIDAARVEVVRGTTFRHTGVDVTGWRYLYRSTHSADTGRVVGALNVTQQARGSKSTAVVSNIYVAEDSRRQGIASRLVALAVDDHPGLTVDSAMTELGGRFFGYEVPDTTETSKGAPSRSRRP